MRLPDPSWPYQPPPSSISSPYRRPRALQPLRQLTTLAAVTLLSSARQPLALGVDVCIRDTPGRGRGLFTLRTLEPGECVGTYDGAIAALGDVDSALFEGRTSASYLLLSEWSGEDVGIDAECDAKQRCPTSYINHSVRRQNCAFEFKCALPWLPKVPLVRTTKQIARGSELLLDYGKDYWDNRGLRAPDPRRIIIDYW